MHEYFNIIRKFLKHLLKSFINKRMSNGDKLYSDLYYTFTTI